jgi:hypothetical protein
MIFRDISQVFVTKINAFLPGREDEVLIEFRDVISNGDKIF